MLNRVLGVLTLLLLGCKQKPPSNLLPKVMASTDNASTVATDAAATPARTGSDKITIRAASEVGDPLSCSGALCAGPLYLGADGTADVTVQGPRGTEVVVLGTKFSLGEKPVRGRVEVRYAMLASPPFALLETYEFPVRVKDAAGKVTHQSITLGFGDFLAKMLSKVSAGPVPWPGETPQKLGMDSLVLIRDGFVQKDYSSSMDERYLTDAMGDGSVYSLDLVAFETSTKREHNCGTYRDSAGGSTTITTTAETTQVVVHNRFTGKTVAKKSFAAAFPRCPRETSTLLHDASVDPTIVYKWLRGFVKTHTDEQFADEVSLPEVDAAAGNESLPAAPDLIARVKAAGYTPDSGDEWSAREEYGVSRLAFSGKDKAGLYITVSLDDFTLADRGSSATAYDLNADRAIWIQAEGGSSWTISTELLAGLLSQGKATWTPEQLEASVKAAKYVIKPHEPFTPLAESTLAFTFEASDVRSVHVSLVDYRSALAPTSKSAGAVRGRRILIVGAQDHAGAETLLKKLLQPL